MEILTATFTITSPNVEKCPDTELPEVAFIGRSNVGKSSLINMLTGKKGLAKVSGTPGKTRMINYFLVNDSWFIVDLPGIGFAKLSRCEMNRLKFMIDGYLTHRSNLRLVFLLVDSRHEPQPIDLEFMEWMIRNKLPFALIFTKTDKLSRLELSAKPARYKKALGEALGIEPEIIITSAAKKTGRKELLDLIEETIREEG
jgi:GTP-binding protein